MKDLSTLRHFIGCDVSKDTLDFAIHARGKDYRTFEHIKVENSLDGFRAMRKWLRSFRIQMKNGVTRRFRLWGALKTPLSSKLLRSILLNVKTQHRLFF